MAPIIRAVDMLSLWASIPSLVMATYLALLALCSRRFGGCVPRPARPPFFDVVIPAHDEEANIAATVASVRALDYPHNRFRVLVVADNCSDSTVRAARAAGAQVLERVDASRRGKGHALAHAFKRSLANGLADAVVVVDADTRVGPDMLRAFASGLERGATVMQGDYRVGNASASWRTRLMVVALATFHGLRSLARERLGLSCGLRGNGMAFSCSLLRAFPYDAFSIVEDLELGIHLGEAGHRVAFIPDATVWGEMATTGPGARSQRRRWEAGRRMLARQHAWRLVRRGISERSKLLFDLGVDLAIPPLATIVAWIVLGMVASIGIATAAHRTGVVVLSWTAWGLAGAFVSAYVVRGAQLSGVGARAVLDLACAPVYVAWKAFVPRHTPSGWVRTPREGTR